MKQNAALTNPIDEEIATTPPLQNDRKSLPESCPKCRFYFLERDLYTQICSCYTKRETRTQQYCTISIGKGVSPCCCSNSHAINLVHVLSPFSSVFKFVFTRSPRVPVATLSTIIPLSTLSVDAPPSALPRCSSFPVQDDDLYLLTSVIPILATPRQLIVRSLVPILWPNYSPSLYADPQRRRQSARDAARSRPLMVGVPLERQSRYPAQRALLSRQRVL